jgi:Icc-related predicted phosphoesterase
MRIVVTSDWHESLPPDVPECDLLLIAGDCLPYSVQSGTYWVGNPPYGARLEAWLERQPAKRIIGIAGNHDHSAVEDPDWVRSLPWTYLENETTEVDGVKIFGTPLAMPFGPYDFMKPDHELADVWKTIPDDVVILMSHGPAEHVLDASRPPYGSRSLRDRLKTLPQLRLLVTGHIHEAYGETAILRPRTSSGGAVWVRCVNGARIGRRGGNPPILIDFQPPTMKEEADGKGKQHDRKGGRSRGRPAR